MTDLAARLDELEQKTTERQILTEGFSERMAAKNAGHELAMQGIQDELKSLLNLSEQTGKDLDKAVKTS